MIKIIINEIPPSNNKFIGRNARWKYQSEKKYWAELVRGCGYKELGKKIEKCIIELNYFFPDRRKRDPDNYSGKFILDGLVKSEIIKDDCFDNINLVLKGGYDKENPRTEIKIQEA